jgi:hypothetical protein
MCESTSRCDCHRICCSLSFGSIIALEMVKGNASYFHAEMITFELAFEERLLVYASLRRAEESLELWFWATLP